MIKNDDLIENGLFDESIKNAATLAKSLDVLESAFKDILTTTSKLEGKNVFKDYDKLKATEKSVSELEMALTGLQQVEEERNKLVKESTLLAQKHQKEIECC